MDGDKEYYKKCGDTHKTACTELCESNAEGKSSKTVVVDKTVHEIKGDTLREMFEKK